MTPRRFVRLLPSLLLLAACSSDPTPQTSPQLSPVTPNPLVLEAPLGQNAIGNVSFQNTGNAPLSYTATASEWLTLNPASGTLAPGGSATLSLQVNCSSGGTFEGFVTVNSNASNGAQSATVQLTCTTPPPPQTGYDIEVRTLGSGFTPNRAAAFATAASVWGTYITGDVTDITVRDGDNASTVCGFDDTTPLTRVDDLLIFARIRYIDGPNGILGQAGPRRVRQGAESNEEFLPYIGCMEFDEADIEILENEGLLDETILHEMGHVVGVGTIWEAKGLLSYDGAKCLESENQIFTGAGAMAEYAELGRPVGRSGPVPVEDDFGEGTKCGHWREAEFDNELMTGIIEEEGINPFSRMTIASLGDLGYAVDVSQGEPYSLPSCSPNCQALRTQSLPGHTELLEPTYTSTPDGKLTPIARNSEE